MEAQDYAVFAWMFIILAIIFVIINSYGGGSPNFLIVFAVVYFAIALSIAALFKRKKIL